MNKRQLISKLKTISHDIDESTVEKFVDGIFSDIKQALLQGHRVEIRGFGSFFLRKRQARLARNPKTGEAVSVKEKNAPAFRMGAPLRKLLNNMN